MLRQGVNRNAASQGRFAASLGQHDAGSAADFRIPPAQGLAFAALVGLGNRAIAGRMMPLPRKQGRGLPFVMLGLMEKIPMTRAGFTALDEELKVLKSVERPAVIRAIAEAREHGDLSENAEYHAAREKQSFIEGRIKELEGMLSLADVIDPSKLSGAIKFGATVKLVDEDTDEEKTYQIVGEAEADIERGLLNIRSPLARALIGKEEGDSVEVKTPGGQKSYEILSIRYL
jgi:transcription elongation factor GreA